MLFIMINHDINNITNLIFTPVVMISETRNFTAIRLLYFQIIITKSSHVQIFYKKSWRVLKRMENVILNFIWWFCSWCYKTVSPPWKKFIAVYYLIFNHGNPFQPVNYNSKPAIFGKINQLSAIIVHLVLFNRVTIVVNTSPKNKVSNHSVKLFCKYILHEGELIYACSFFNNF